MHARRVVSGLIAGAALMAVVVVCVARGPQVVEAAGKVSWTALVILTALHVLTLAVRTEAWRVSLHAIDGRTLPRIVVHGANAGAFLAGAVQSQAAMPARLTLLRRLAGARAPRPMQVAVSEVPVFVLEVAATCLLVAVAAGLAVAGGGDARVGWSALVVGVALGLGLPLLARHAAARFAHRSMSRGLAVLGMPSLRWRFAAGIVVVCGLGVLRSWLALSDAGLPHGLSEVAMVFAALGVLGLLPIGPSASPAATLAVVGTTDVDAALAAGLALSASSIVGVLLYLSIVVAGRAVRGGGRLAGDDGPQPGTGPSIGPRFGVQPWRPNARKRLKRG
jgi:hypothetical protein